MEIQIVKFGTPVLIANGTIKGLITAVSIRDTYMQYEVSYFSNGQHTSMWITRIEFEIDENQPKKAGLVNYDNQQKLIT